jgi:hypothetical protein
MAMRTRITLTKKECESPSGKRLVDLIFSMCHDGCLDIAEVDQLHIFLRNDNSTIAAFPYLRAITREAVADGAINDAEAYALKLAFERVIPKEARGIVSTHLQNIGLPAVHEDEFAGDWTEHEATHKQIDYIVNLGGTVMPGLTKGQASQLIDQLLQRRPPTPRQTMLLRFFDRLDLLQATKDEVSLWIDQLYASDGRLERAWDRFKRETNHDPFEQDATVVPVGAFKKYSNHRPA